MYQSTQTKEFAEQLEEQSLRGAMQGAGLAVVGGIAIAGAESSPIHEVAPAHIGGLAVGVSLIIAGLGYTANAIRLHWQADQLR